EEAHFGVGDVQVAANGSDEEIQDLAIDERKNVGEGKNEDAVPGARGAGVGGRGIERGQAGWGSIGKSHEGASIRFRKCAGHTIRSQRGMFKSFESDYQNLSGCEPRKERSLESALPAQSASPAGIEAETKVESSKLSGGISRVCQWKLGSGVFQE